MTHVEDKIRKLLALAAHPNTPVDEARTAAVTAAKLMAENKVEVGVAVEPSTPIFGPPIHASRAVVIGTLIHELLEIMLRARPEPPRPPPRPPERDPMLDPRFWDEWEKRQKRPRRRSKQSRKNNPNRERKRKTR